MERGPALARQAEMTESTPALRDIDDDTLLDMFDHAHETSDEQCVAIAAELHWRGIEVPACKTPHTAA